MSNLTLINKIESLVIHGDLSKLTAEEKVFHYKNVCETAGLNPMAKPFDYLKLNGKEVLYANKGCAEQLRSIHKISIKIVDKQKIDDIFIVVAEATNADGRVDSSTGAVSIAGLKGEALANAFLKTETKAKRRVTLSICGLNMLDESEIDSIPDATKPVENPFVEERIAKELIAHDPGHYIVTFGKHKGHKLNSMDVYELNGYVKYIRDSASSRNKELTGQVLEFVEHADAFLKSREFQHA